MGKAKIISGGTDGRYQIKILTLKTKAEARIDALQDKIDELRSGEEVAFSPTLLDQYNTLLDLIDQYRDAIEDNRNKEENQQELTQEIALEQQKLETLEDDLSYLESIRDTRLEEYEEAEYYWEHEEITEDEYLFYQSRYLTAQANVVAKLASIAVRQAVVDALEAEKSAIKFAELDKDLDVVEKKSETFFEFDAKETLDQLDSHIDYGETLVSHMAQAFNASIEWYNDAEQQNYLDALDKAEWTEEQYPISVHMNEAHTEMSAAKTARDSAQEEYDEQYVSYIRGDIGEEDMQAAEDALVLAQANYSAKLAQYNVYYDQWEDLEIQINSCVVIDTAPMKTRVDKTNTEYAVMSQDLASLTAFRDRQELKITSLEKELDRLEAAVDAAERQVDAWCADLTEDLEADTEVGTIEIKGEPDTILVHPGYEGAAVYNQARDGQLQPPEISTAAQAFYNYALLPGWQKWKPMFRLGEITELSGNTCTVALDAALSVAQGLDVNQSETLSDVPIEYMYCNGSAFEVGDRVVVRFNDQDWSQPTVIGFEEEPQDCNTFVCLDNEKIKLLCGAEDMEFSPIVDLYTARNAWFGATTYTFYPSPEEHPAKSICFFRQTGARVALAYPVYYVPTAALDMRMRDGTETTIKRVYLEHGAISYHIDDDNEQIIVVFLTNFQPNLSLPYEERCARVGKSVYDFNLDLISTDTNYIDGCGSNFYGIPTINYDSGVINVSISILQLVDLEDPLVYNFPLFGSASLPVAKNNLLYFDNDPVTRSAVSQLKETMIYSVERADADEEVGYRHTVSTSLGPGTRTGWWLEWHQLTWPEVYVMAAYYDPGVGWVVWDNYTKENISNLVEEPWLNGDIYLDVAIRRNGVEKSHVTLELNGSRYSQIERGFSIQALIEAWEAKADEETYWYFPATCVVGGYFTDSWAPVLIPSFIAESSAYYEESEAVRTFRQVYYSDGTAFEASCDGAAIDIPSSKIRMATGLFLATND